MDPLVEVALSINKNIWYMAFSGTEISITITTSLSSVIAKVDEVSNVRYPKVFKSAFLDDDEKVEQFISRIIDVKPLKLSKHPEVMEMLQGRRRIAVMFIYYLFVNLKNEKASKQKQIIESLVEEAAKTVYNRVVTDIVKILTVEVQQHQSMSFMLSTYT
jgi:hypothetical protein